MTVLVVLLISTNLTWLVILARTMKANNNTRYVRTMDGWLEIKGYSVKDTLKLMETLGEFEP